MENNFEIGCKKGQITIFIIIAILIVAGIVGIVLLRGRIEPVVWPRDVLPVHEYFLSCVKDETKLAASIMGSQAGYLELPEFEPGSDYAPFSSQLNFLGFGVPYWYYVSGNGINKEQVPSERKMESQLENYLEERIMKCSFADFEAQGYNIDAGDPKVEVEIKDREIKVEVEMPLIVSYGEVVGRQTKHSVKVKSKLGRFYNTARKIYDAEQENLFLENYGVDVLRLYAPVDGSEIGCSPKIWQVNEIREDLVRALEANIPAIKVKGDYYKAKGSKYFVQDIGDNVEEYVNFLYLSDWPTKIEIWPDEDPLIAEPVGLQEGLGILGFCYVPYHFVYDMTYPVLVQIYDGTELFQFPIAVVIDKNKPRQAVDVEGLPDVVPELCEHKLTEMEVYTYDNKLEPIEADIKYKCFDTSCYIGRTEKVGEDAVLTAKFPQCINGFVIARAEGYETKKYVVSTVESGEAVLVLDKEYEVDLEVRKGVELGDDYAIVTFVRQDGKTITVVYPEQEKVKLTEGMYEVKVYVYSNSTISLKGSTTEKCIDVPRSGLLGIFGSTEEKCFTIKIPDQIVSSAVSGGGKQTYYFNEEELAGKMIINAKDFGVPSKIEELQANYNDVELNELDISFE